MATEYDNTNRGSLFTKKRKEKDTHPDYTGSINVGGTEYWLSAWKRYSAKSGEPFLSISVQEKDQTKAKPAAPRSDVDEFLGAPEKLKGTQPEFTDDDIPF